MQKINAIFLVLIFAIFQLTHLSSCRKCISCERKDAAGNVLMQATKTCGSKKELEEAEKKVKDQASLLIGETYSCVEVD